MKTIESFGFQRDHFGKGLSFFSLHASPVISHELLEILAETSYDHGRINARLCLHPDVESSHHDMVILEWRNSFYPPHMHVEKSETCHIVKGKVGVFIFDEAGIIERAISLDIKTSRIMRIAAGQWHTLIPISKFAIYLESKNGPYRRDSNWILPSWTENILGNPVEESAYMKGLLQSI